MTPFVVKATALGWFQLLTTATIGQKPTIDIWPFSAHVDWLDILEFNGDCVIATPPIRSADQDSHDFDGDISSNIPVGYKRVIIFTPPNPSVPSVA